MGRGGVDKVIVIITIIVTIFQTAIGLNLKKIKPAESIILFKVRLIVTKLRTGMELAVSDQ